MILCFSLKNTPLPIKAYNHRRPFFLNNRFNSGQRPKRTLTEVKRILLTNNAYDIHSN
jgi:hypothetical protein